MLQKSTIKEILLQTKMYLHENRSGEILLGFVLNVSRAFLYAHGGRVLTAQEIALFEALVARRLQGEPIAYLVGEKEFYSLLFKVTKDTLIPRPETEVLVEETLRLMGAAGGQILELGTGSGAIAVTLAKLRPHWQVLATDYSESALSVAQINAKTYDLKNISFIKSDWFAAIEGRFNLIVSNPPYIAMDDPHLTELRFEPLSALQAGEKGLDDIEKIIQHAPGYLLPDGYLLLEHGYDQSDSVSQRLGAAGFLNIKSIPDLTGHLRVTYGQWR